MLSTPLEDREQKALGLARTSARGNDRRATGLQALERLPLVAIGRASERDLREGLAAFGVSIERKLNRQVRPLEQVLGDLQEFVDYPGQRRVGRAEARCKEIGQHALDFRRYERGDHAVRRVC